MSSPTERTLNALRRAGWYPERVEHWVPFPSNDPSTGRDIPGRRRDLWNLFDVLAIRLGRGGVLGIQCCSSSDVGVRLTKLRASALAKVWVLAGNGLWVVGWPGPKARKEGTKGARVVAMTVESFSDIPVIRTAGGYTTAAPCGAKADRKLTSWTG
jgi:hypothetical protein